MHAWLNCYVITEDETSGSGFVDDEDDCPDGTYLCIRSTMCILESSLCDGINDCGNWEDESVSVCESKWSLWLRKVIL